MTWSVPVAWGWHPLGDHSSVTGKAYLADQRPRYCVTVSLRSVPRYLKYTLDQCVESDYTIVYFHMG